MTVQVLPTMIAPSLVVKDLCQPKNTFRKNSISHPISYDAAGNRLSKTTAAGTETYGYDNLYQLTSAQYPTGSPFANSGFNYDPLGNRTTVTNGAATTYTANNLNQYTQVNTNTLNYDPNGNLTSYNGWALSYDFENRLIGATNGTITAAYSFDPFGRRISKTVNGTATNFVYDGEQIIAEYDANNILQKKYIYGPSIDEPIAIVSGTSTYYYNRDGLGSTSELTDNTGTVMESYAYDVYGKTIIKDGSGNVLGQSAVGNTAMFTGRNFDAETGLYYYRARMYSPDLGRFLQVDPIGYYGDINLYGYTHNNPVNWVDPSGLVSLNLAPNNDKIGKAQMDRINPPGVYSVGGHGAADAMGDSSGNRLTPSQLADKIIQDNVYTPGQTVQLLSCNTGSQQAGFGHQLADELTKRTGIETTVIAPDNYFLTNDYGEYGIANNGQWQSFKGKLKKIGGVK